MAFFQHAVNTNASFSRFTNIGRDLYNIQTNSLDFTLQKLEPARMDASDRSECLQGTRTDILHTVVEWALFSDLRVLWFHGVAGCGKSTLATTVANHFREQGRLGAFVFFNRDTEERSQPSNVVRTIAYQLGSFDTRIGTMIAAAIKKTPSIAQSPLRLQFLKLLIEPLSMLPPSEEPIVVVLDALDECGNASSRASLLSLFTAECVHLPSFIRILITSRAEYDISMAFTDLAHIIVQEVELVSSSNTQDILSFIQHRMVQIRSGHQLLQFTSDWPGLQAIHNLAQQADGLFVWASTACLFIQDGHDPRSRLKTLLEREPDGSPETSLDSIYRTALSSAGRWEDDDFCSDFHAIMGTIVVARNPLSDTAIDTILSLQRQSLHTILRLRCVLRWKATEPVRLLHPSFADFLTSQHRCGFDRWHIDTSSQNEYLLFHCLNYLDGVLKHNICNLKFSPVLVQEILPEPLAYASGFWIDHICAIKEGTVQIAELLEQFLFRHLLHWLEVMSIQKKSRTIITSLQHLHDWLMIRLPHQNRLNVLVQDARRMVQAFSSDIEAHPLCVYLTVLPFMPIHTLLYSTFAALDFPWVVGGYNKHWPRLHNKFRALKGWMHYVALSPDGKYIATSDHRTIHVWDAISGVKVLEPLRGHTRRIYSAVFSNDGRRIASGSRDKTVRLWNASSGVEILPPLQGHTGAVLSVTFSPDGTQISSGSFDQTVRLWDVSGSELVAVLRGHENAVESVVFTTDGRRIISSSWDRTIRIWDAASGTHIMKSFHGHSSVAISTNGKSFASISEYQNIIHVWPWDAVTGRKDLALRTDDGKLFSKVSFFPGGARVASFGSQGIDVWDTTTGSHLLSITASLNFNYSPIAISADGKRCAAGDGEGMISVWDAIQPGMEDVPLGCAHKRQAYTIVFTPDGQQIASCDSGDYSICIWDVRSGAALRAPMKGHTDHIYSAMFSPQGERLVSGSADTTVRVWDIISGTEVHTHGGHKGPVYSVAFSPDGSYIVSGSADGSVRLWDATSGMLIFTMRGHKGEVHSTAFASDGRYIVSCCPPRDEDDDRSQTTSIHLWDITSGVEIRCLLVPRSIPFEVDSAAISADGQHILVSGTDFVSICYGVLAWDINGFGILEKYYKIQESCNVRDPIIVTSDNWVVDVAHDKVVGKIPASVSIRAFAASPTSIAFMDRHRDRSMFIIHFPSTSLTSGGVWDSARLSGLVYP